MSVGRFLTPDFYSYLIFCEEPEATYIKIGVSKDPMKRLQQICNGIPFKPKTMSFLNMGSEQMARNLESTLLGAFPDWDAAGEWKKIKPYQLASFLNTVCMVTAHFETGGLRRRWAQLNVNEYRKQQRQKRYAGLKKGYFLPPQSGSHKIN